MATYYIVLGATDLNATATYNTAEDGSGSAPANIAALDGDDIILSRGTQTAFTNVTALAAVDINSFTICPPFTGNFGSAGASVSLLMTAASPSKLIIESGGANVFITSAGTIEQCEVISGGNVQLTGGTISDLRITGGVVGITGAAVTAAYQTGGSVTTDKLGTAFTAYYQTGGMHWNKRNTTTLHISGQARNINDGDAAITTANVYGGYLNLRSTTTTAIGTLNLHTGTVTPAMAKSNQVVTTANVFGANGQARLVTQAGSRLLTPGTANYYGRGGGVVDSVGGGGFTELMG